MSDDRIDRVDDRGVVLPVRCAPADLIDDDPVHAGERNTLQARDRRRNVAALRDGLGGRAGLPVGELDRRGCAVVRRYRRL